MDLVLCHTTADFDTLGAAVGITLLNPAARIVLAGGCHPTVQVFLALHRDEYPLIERRAVELDAVQTITIVDTQSLGRLGPLGRWVTEIAQQDKDIIVYDHHGGHDIGCDGLPATQVVADAVGAATTLVVEALQAQNVTLTVAQATVMALGIHVDTGSLTFLSATARDARALAWLLGQGASQSVIAEFVEPNLSPTLQTLSEQAIAQIQRETYLGHTLGWVLLETAKHVSGLSGLAERLITFLDLDSLLFGAWFPTKAGTYKLVLIGRARGRVAAIAQDAGGLHLGRLFAPLGGGGHATAAAATCVTANPQADFARVLAALRQQIPPVPTARDVMSSPVRTILPATRIAEAQRILLRYGHSGLSVVDQQGQLVGVISRRDIDLALHHGFGHAPVKGYMSTQVKTITPQTSLPEIEALMVTYDIGRLPVLSDSQLVGVVTRTDVLRQIHQSQRGAAALRLTAEKSLPTPTAADLWQTLQRRLPAILWQMLQAMSAVACDRGWQLYLVGGGVRDLFLTDRDTPLNLPDVDLVVDSAYQTLEMGAGVVLAEAIKADHPQAELQVYGRFQTAALVWHESPTASGSLMVDIATARTEFYPYPAANPEVEASSIRQDLYRRDFTINALAIRLTPPQPGQLLDFFGGLLDLRERYIRVLHANSFIEDPTRIYRAVRFAVRLGFSLEPQTESFIRYAIESGVFRRLQAEIAKLPALQARLKTELQYILEADYWEPALAQLANLGALTCLHPELTVSAALWQQLRRLSRWLSQVGSLSQLTPWQVRLELLLVAIPETDRGQVATNLQLPHDNVQRINTFATAEQHLLAQLPMCDRPSQYVNLFASYDLITLLLMSLRHGQQAGSHIWRYLTDWSQVTAPLNGNDLKRLGYRPGPAYRKILAAVLAATLDGGVGNHAEAITFVLQHFPPPPRPSIEETHNRDL
ncbi:MAG: CBS domain-containing protein [Leptolyngbyaceae cyanobacterium]